MERESSFNKGLETMKEMLGEEYVKQRTNMSDLDKYTVEILFGEIWNRPFLDRKTRSLITVTALTVLGREAQLPIHLRAARKNGVSKEEVEELMTHLAFYAGWPAANTGFKVVKEVFG